MLYFFIATSNPGKLRDFAAAAQTRGIQALPIPDFDKLEEVEEDGDTFEANARKKAEVYSRYAPGEIVIADDSGLVVDALNGAPGVHSARFAAKELKQNSSDSDNNKKLLAELAGIPRTSRQARFVCVIAAARDGKTLALFEGEVEGQIMDEPRGHDGFGYDPLFYVPTLGKTFAEMSPEGKSKYSHRGQAFYKFLEWMRQQKTVAHP